MILSRCSILALAVLALTAAKCPKATKTNNLFGGSSRQVDEFVKRAQTDDFAKSRTSDAAGDGTHWMTDAGFDAALEAGKLALDPNTGIYRHENGTGWNPEESDRVYLPSCWDDANEFKCQAELPPTIIPTAEGGD